MKSDLIKAGIFLTFGLISLSFSGGITPPRADQPGQEYKSFRQRQFERIWLGQE